jgi:uncharacterized protein with LGFP repeats
LQPIDEHVDKSEPHGFQPTKQGSMARNIQGDFGRLGAPQTSQSSDSNGHFGHFGHFVALPNTGENKSSEIYKNRENKKEVRTASGMGMPKMPEMPIGRLISTAAALPAMTIATRFATLAALDLEIYRSYKGDRLGSRKIRAVVPGDARQIAPQGPI